MWASQVFKPRLIRSQTQLPGSTATSVVALGEGSRGFRGVVVQVGCDAAGSGGSLEHGELERRLLEMGFVEGARVEILHEGAIGRDPIAVKLDDSRVALRRREAASIMVRLGEAANDELTPRLEAAE